MKDTTVNSQQPVLSEDCVHIKKKLEIWCSCQQIPKVLLWKLMNYLSLFLWAILVVTIVSTSV